MRNGKFHLALFSIPLALLVLWGLFGRGWFGHPLSFNGISLNTPGGRCLPPFGDFLTHPRGRVFSLEFESKSHSDWASLFSGSKSKSPLQQKAELNLKAEWFVTVISHTDERYLLANQLVSPKVSLAQDIASSPEETQQRIEHLSKEFFVEVNSTGEVLSLQFHPELNVIEKNILRWIVSNSQIVFPSKGESPGKKWRSTERDPNGLYEASYKLTKTNDKALGLEKRKMKYLELGSMGRQRAKTLHDQFDLDFAIETQSRLMGDFDCRLGVFSMLSGNENSKTLVSRNVIAEKEDQFKLKFEKETAVSNQRLKSLLAKFSAMSSKRSSYSLTADDSTQHMEKLIQEQELGNLTEEKLLSMLAHAKKSGDSDAVDALYLKVKALVYLHPESSKSLSEILSTEDPSSETMKTLATALSTVGHPEAQNALLSALEARTGDVAAAEVLIPAIGMTEHPTLQSETALRNLIRSSKEEDIVTAAGLSLGAVAAHLADAPDRRKQIVSDLQNDYDRADTLEQKKFLVSVLGNAGSADSTPLLGEALKSKDPLLQAEAAMALRFVPGKDVDHKLLNALTESQDEALRRSAASALGYRLPSQDLSEKMRSAFSSEKSDGVRSEMIKSIYELRRSDPKTLEWLRTVQSKDPSEQIRQLAKDYRGLSEDG